MTANEPTQSNGKEGTDSHDRATTTRDVAAVGSRLGDDGTLFVTAIRAMASAPHDVGTDAWTEFVAAQVYDAAPAPDTAAAQAFVEQLQAAHGLETLTDVDTLLGREAYERTNYEGHLAFVEADP